MKTRLPIIPVVLLSNALLLSACGGGGGSGRIPTPPPTPKPGSIQFETTALTVDEVAAGTTVSVNISRAGGSDGAVSVTIAPSGTATGADYTLAGTTVSFAAGDAATKELRIIVKDDADFEPEETLVLTLSAPTGGATIGTNVSATLTIKDNDPPPAPALSAVTSDVKQLKFSWGKSEGATSYRLLESIDGDGEFTPVEPALELGAEATSATLDIAVHGTDWLNTQYKVEACVDDRCSGSNAAGIAAAMLGAIGSFNGVNTSAGDGLGHSVAISRDGKTIAVGAPREDSEVLADGSCGAKLDKLNQNSGSVYLFVRDDQGHWSEQACVKAYNSSDRLGFGAALALSDDGSVLAVGAPGEDSNVIQPAPDLTDSGAAYIFVRDDQQQWFQEKRVKPLNAAAFDALGGAVALSGDGSTLAVSTAVKDNRGAVYVFVRGAGKQITQQGFLHTSDAADGDFFGASIALNRAGDTLAIGATSEDSNADAEVLPALPNSGAVYVFDRDAAGLWTRQALLKAENARTDDHFGSSVALSADGRTLAGGAPDAGGLLPGLPTVAGTGAAYVFTRAEADWSQSGYVVADNPSVNLRFGQAVALSEDGDVLAVGGPNEDSNATSADPIIENSGAAYVFARFDGEYFPVSRVKAKDPLASGQLGSGLGLSADGFTLAVGAPALNDGGSLNLY